MASLHRVSHNTQDPARTDLQRVTGDIARGLPFQITVERWAARFRSGNADVTDLPLSGRSVSATTSENIALIESMVMKDKCITVNQLEQSMEISSGAIHTILTTEPGYRSICGKWVPHKLSQNQRLARLNIAKKLLETYENCDSRRLTEIITGDETWVYYSTPYSKYKKRSWEISSRRQLIKQRLKEQTGNVYDVLDYEDEISDIEEQLSSEYEEYSDSDDEEGPLRLKPFFVKK
ncbi:Transposase [Oopsacas minuta]|uniref:Transposase n=1 Tax=Oopsacas minuta TaxID=111878 RepID=A0AAV7JG20_9METZ|nr:Transposase [Oopsacas minuta]